MARIINLCLLIFFITALNAFIAGKAYPQTQEYKEYVVSRGDTLWSIATKEIVDPFLWPKIWKENPDIKNPDLLYPGQVIKIPMYLIQIQKEAFPKPAPEITPETGEIKRKESGIKIIPAEKEYLIDMDTLIASGYIAESIDSKGKIAGSPTDRTLLGRGDYAYIQTLNPAGTGDKFYIIRSLGKVKHPEYGNVLGYLIDVVGIAEVVGKESGETKIKIAASYSEVHVGDQLNEYYEIEQPFLVDKPRTPDINGFVVAAKQRRILNAQSDIVYIDRGVKDGIQVGDIARIISTGKKYNIPNGVLQVISTKETTATAIVRKSGKEVVVGDRVSALQ